MPKTVAPPPPAESPPVRDEVSKLHATAPQGVRILVVEDNPRVRRSTATLLSRIGFHVMTAEDGGPAIELAETNPPDLALVDLEMPTPGLVVVRKLKALYGAAIWVAVLSGNDEADVPTKCFDAGADDVIMKPAPVAELHRRVVAAARTQQAYVDARVARERTDRLLAYGAEAAAMLAHDLNNGLAVALSNMDYLENTVAGLDSEQSLALVSTRNALRRMSGLVANFVDIARFEDAAVKPQCAVVNVRNLIDTVVQVHVIGGRVSVSIECDADLTSYFDVALIERVLHNLLGNAVRYCRANGKIRISALRCDDADPQAIELAQHSLGGGAADPGAPWKSPTILGSPRRPLEVPDDPWKSPTTLGSPRRPLEVPDGGRGTGDRAGAIEITVFNNGPRISPELETSLFGKYAKGTDGKRGVGLYFCRLACEAHNGRIMYRGSDDGAAFVIRLPGRG